jgi:outer membrane protein assembly factor BamB
LGPDNVHVFFDHTGTQFDAIVERRSSSASLLWSTRLANVNFNNGARHCELAVTSELIALSSRSSETTLAALSHDGALKWRTTLNSDLPSELRASVTGLLVASQQQTKNGLLTVLERRRAIDGNVDWSATIPGRAVDLQHIGGEVHVSWATEGDTTELHLQRRNAASGALVAEHVARAQGFAMRPADMRIIEGFPVSPLAGLGAERRSTKIERLNPATGEPLELEETPGEVLQAAVFPGSAGRILALVYYTSADGLLHRQSLLALNADTGSLIWQSAMQRPLTQGTLPIAAQVRALADGSVYITSRSCDNPPVCSNALPIVSRLSAATGQRIWFAAAEGFTGVRGLDLLVGNFASTLVMLSAANGSELWRQTMPANSFVLETLSATAGDLFVLRQFSLNGQRAQLDRRFGGSGVLQWTVDPRAWVLAPVVCSTSIRRLPSATATSATTSRSCRLPSVECRMALSRG